MHVWNQKVDILKVSRWQAVDMPRVADRKPMNMTHYDTKSIMPKFWCAVKVQKWKNLPKFLGAKCGQTTPIWKFGGQKHQKYHELNLACCFRMTTRCQNWKNLPKFPGAKCGQTAPNWQLLFTILIGSSYLITILFIIWAGFMKYWIWGKSYFKQSLL